MRSERSWSLYRESDPEHYEGPSSDPDNDWREVLRQLAAVLLLLVVIGTALAAVAMFC